MLQFVPECCDKEQVGVCVRESCALFVAKRGNSVLHNDVVQCVAVCCSVLQCVAVCCIMMWCSVLQCVAVCCSVLQCVAECWIMMWCLRLSFACFDKQKFGVCVCVCVVWCVSERES